MKKSRIVFLAAFFSFLVFMGAPSELISADNNQVKKEVKQTLKQEANEPVNPYATAKISIKIIPSVNKTYGYDILMSGKPMIHQPSIPALPGNEGFKTKKQAQKVAEFVVKKIRKNEMPPAVTVEDLKRMKVLN
ncbi:MAG: DUF4907 domain-containing protein [Smithella sp.]